MNKRKSIEQKNLKVGKQINTSGYDVNNSSSFELKKLSTILVSIIGVVCIFYIITVVVTKNIGGLRYSKDDEISEISYTDILASDILKKEGSYYVLVHDNDDVYMELYNSYLSSYTSSEDSLSVYYVDLNDALNKKYKADENDFSSSNLHFSGTVLLKVANGNVESHYADNESISEHLKSLR